MDYWDVTKVLFRRWYIAVPLLLLTVVATAYIAAVVQPDYQLTAYVQLIPAATSPQTTTYAPQNPWNQLGLDALTEAADYSTLDQTFLNSLKNAGLSTNVTMTVGETPAGATIEVVASSQAQAEQTMQLAIERFRGSVRDLQAGYGVRSQDLITVTRLDSGQNLKRPGGKVKRAFIAVAATGLLITCASTIATDVLLRRRRRPAGNAGTSGEGSGGEPQRAPAAAVLPVQRNGRRFVPAASRQPGPAAPAREPAGDAVSAQPAGGAGPDLIPAMPSDATIVLPRALPVWDRRTNGGGQR